MSNTPSSVDSLLQQIKQRRKQAMELVDSIERSLRTASDEFDEPTGGIEGESRPITQSSKSEYYTPGPEEPRSTAFLTPCSNRRNTQAFTTPIRDTYTGSIPSESLPRDLSNSPPESLFEGFTNDFVANYRPTKSIYEPLLRYDTTNALSVTAESIAPPSIHPTDTSFIDINAQSEDCSIRYSTSQPDTNGSIISDYHGSTTPSNNQEIEYNAEPKYLPKINRSARKRIWNRIAQVKSNEENETENASFVHWLVGLSKQEETKEYLKVEQHQVLNNYPNTTGQDHGGVDSKSEGDKPQEEPKGLRKEPKASVVYKDPDQFRSSDSADSVDWVDGEWMKWGDIVCSCSDSGERLNALHELLMGSKWLLGFHDQLMPNGKLERVYQDSSVLVAYPDGTVKRELSSSTTIYYLNGDWEFIPTASSLGCPSCYYYYSDQDVWEIKSSSGSEYMFPDGSLEFVAAK